MNHNQGMDGCIMLLCSYDNKNVVVVVCADLTFSRFTTHGVKRGRSLTHGHDDIGGDGGEMVTNIDEEADLLPNFCQHVGKLRWYSDAVMEYNPESYINLDFDEHNTRRFNRLFISFKACMDGFNHCCPLLFLDGTFLKGRFKGNLLVATGKDGNLGLFLVAFAIVDSENAVNWAWFLQNLANVVDRDRNLTFVSDRHVGIIESLPTVFQSAHHAFCMQHLQRNLKDKMKYVNKLYRIALVSKLRECAYAPTVAEFNEKIKAFIQSGRHIAVNFLQDLKPHHWENAYFRGNRYGEMCSNVAESFNNWIKKARHLPITQMVDAIRTQIMNQMSDRRGASSSWAGVICPKMEYKLEMAYKKGRSWTVSQSNNDVYEVHSHLSVLVDIGRRTCSCFQWQINGLPCEHVVVAIRNSGSDLNALVDPYFYVTNYQSSYSEAIFPIPTVEKPQVIPGHYGILPVTVRRPPDRPKKKRIPSKGEEVQQI
ncbi:uncharacterized protein LOC114315084 [Camellia sinensis]|uniref:uncharacterized protein LOC114315084 n=1 Tax=Camellia sinensis TaxID=4442 RepID=UPI00103646A0|nr:uncharacterized protein LOC114315084 [Camellia sinensis]